MAQGVRSAKTARYRRHVYLQGDTAPRGRLDELLVARTVPVPECPDMTPG